MTPVELHWRDFMQRLADADPAAVVVINDGTGDYELTGVRYHCIPPTPGEAATLHRDHGALLETAGTVIAAAARR